MASCFDMEDDAYLPDTLLYEVSKKMPFSDYRVIAPYLGVTADMLQQLHCERNVAAQVREVFSVWFNQSTGTGRWMELKMAYEQCYRNDLIRDTRDFFQEYNITADCDYHQPKNMHQKWKVESYFAFMAPKLTNDWKDLAMYLGLSMSQIQAIGTPPPSDSTEYNPVFRVLKMWKYQRISPPCRLIQVLSKDMGRVDIAIFVEGLTAAVATHLQISDVDPIQVTLV